MNHAHVQPTGEYHYHGMPELLLDLLGQDEKHDSCWLGFRWLSSLRSDMGIQMRMIPAVPSRLLSPAGKLKR